LTTTLRQNLSDGLRLRSPLQVMFVAGVGLFIACVIAGLGTYLVQQRTLPNILLNHLQEGDALVAAGNFHAAVDAYRTATLLIPDDIEALLRLHSAASRAGDNESAWWALSRAFVLVPGDVRVLYGLGEAHLADGQLQLALVSFERAFAAARVAELAYKVGYVHQKQGHSAEAIEWLQRALVLDANHADARTLLNALQRSQP